MKINYSNVKKYLSMGMVLLMTSFPVNSKGENYQVKLGDTMETISTKFYGTSEYSEQLNFFNQIPETEYLEFGENVEIPELDVLLKMYDENCCDSYATFGMVLDDYSYDRYDSDHVKILMKINGIGNRIALYDGRNLHIPSISNLLKYYEFLDKAPIDIDLSEYYFVEHGDDLYSICYKIYGNYDNVSHIKEINFIEDEMKIEEGKLLHVPKMEKENVKEKCYCQM